MKYHLVKDAKGWNVIVMDEQSAFTQAVGPFRSRKIANENIEYISAIAGRAWLNGGYAQARHQNRS